MTTTHSECSMKTILQSVTVALGVALALGVVTSGVAEAHSKGGPSHSGGMKSGSSSFKSGSMHHNHHNHHSNYGSYTKFKYGHCFYGPGCRQFSYRCWYGRYNC